MYLCNCAHPHVFVITSLTDYDVDPPAMPPRHACLNEMSHSWFIVEYEIVYICICEFVFLWYIPSTHACMNQLMNEMPPSSYDPLTQWGFVCVLVLSEKNTLNEKLSVFVIYAAIRSLTKNYSNNLFLSLDMNGIVDATGIASDYNTAACKFWFRVLIIKLFLLLKVFLHRRQAGCPGMKCKQA